MLPSKCHDVPVSPGDVLHFVTWGGGGWGDPLARDPALVALEVRRGLVTADGARRYGVVVGAGRRRGPGRPTEALRAEIAAERPAELPIFNMGPPLAELLERCQEETGLPAPKPAGRAVTSRTGLTTRRGPSDRAGGGLRARRLRAVLAWGSARRCSWST